VAVDGKDSAERDQTDDGLRKERLEADRALTERQAAIEKDADIVVQHARDTADAVLTAAREEADQHLDRSATPSVAREAADKLRVREDEAVLAERQVADETLQRERDETARVLRGLLPLERERTDRYLFTERLRSDEALSNRDDFLGLVSHDLRDLLGGIVTSAVLLDEYSVPLHAASHYPTWCCANRRFCDRSFPGRVPRSRRLTLAGPASRGP
jgi:signal transduction histidine kinase